MGGAFGCLRPSQSANAVQPLAANDSSSQHMLADDNNSSHSPPASPTPLDAAHTLHRLLSDTDITANLSSTQSALSISSSAYPPTSHSSSPHPFSATAPLPSSLPSIPSVLQRHLMKQAQLRLIKDVKRTMFAQCLDSDELRAFAALFQLVEAAPGELIFQQGGPADCFYLIRKGAVNIKFSDKESAMLAADASSAVNSPIQQYVTVDTNGHVAPYHTAQPARVRLARPAAALVGGREDGPRQQATSQQHADRLHRRHGQQRSVQKPAGLV